MKRGLLTKATNSNHHNVKEIEDFGFPSLLLMIKPHFIIGLITERSSRFLFRLTLPLLFVGRKRIIFSYGIEACEPFSFLTVLRDHSKSSNDALGSK